MQTKFAKHLKPLWNLAMEIGNIGEEDSRYGAVYEKLSAALDVAEEVGLTTNVEMYEGAARVFYTTTTFGKDSRQGIHLLQPNALELGRALEDAEAKGFRKIYIHSK